MLSSNARPTLVPMRWPQEWRDPSLLELLKDTPVNCLVAGGGTPAPPAAVAEAAKQAGMTWVEARASSSIAWTERAKAPWKGPESVLAITDGVWPGVQSRSRQEAGPTGAPWIDSNGWMIQLSRARAGGKHIWIAADPPKADFIRPSVYELAVADAHAYGAKWVVSLDKQLSDALAQKNSTAVDTWKKIASALRFFDARKDWAAYKPVGALGIVSDFEGPNEFLAGEVLNLTARRSLPFRILEKSHAAAASFAGLKAIIYTDEQPPDPPLMKKLAAFATDGGLLMVPAKFPAPKGAPLGDDVYGRNELRKVGKGRIAVAKEESQDPYYVAADVQLLMSHRNDLVRFFNTGTLNCYYTSSADGGKSVLHVINFAMRLFGSPVSVAFTRRFRSARIWKLEDTAAAPLELFPTEDGGAEVHLPAFNVYAAVELES